MTRKGIGYVHIFQPAASFTVNKRAGCGKTRVLISHSVDAVAQEQKILPKNISVIDGYMVVAFALGIINFRANSNKYHLKLDLKGELAFVHQQRLSEVATSIGARCWRSRGNRCKLMMSEAFLCFSPNPPLIPRIATEAAQVHKIC